MMTIRNPSNVPIKNSSTEFQLHINYLQCLSKQLIDFSEKRLLKMIDIANDFERKSELKVILSDYVNGKIALAWQQGMPVWVRMSKENGINI